MMNPPVLTIAIPTYNRPQAVQRLVRALLPQRNSRWRLLVIDNHSETPVRDLLPAEVEVIRNPVNVGIVGNVVRCFELAQTDWVWVCGDDDLIAPDGVSRVLAALEKYPDAAVLNFGAAGSTDGRREPVSCDGVDGFLAHCDHFGVALWISLSVYSRRHYWDHLRFAYTFSATTCPHFVLGMMGLMNGGTYVMLPTTLFDGSAERAHEGGWNYSDSMTCVSWLLDLPFTKKQRIEFARLLQRTLFKLPRDLVHCSFLMRASELHSDVLYLFMLRWTHLAVAKGSMTLLGGAFLGRMMLTFAPTRAALRLIGAAKGKLTGHPFEPQPITPRFHRI